MDLLAAIGLATNILTFVDFSWKLLAGARELYQSSSGQTVEDAFIARNISELQRVVEDLDTDGTGDSVHEKVLQELASRCASLSSELVNLLDDLRKKGHSKWGAVKGQLKRMRKKDEITNLQRRIDEYRSQILVRLALMMRSVPLWRRVR